MSNNLLYFRLIHQHQAFLHQCVCVGGGGRGRMSKSPTSHHALLLRPPPFFVASSLYSFFDPTKIKYCQVISPASCHFGTPISQPFSPNSLIWLPSLNPLGSCLPFLLQYHLLLVQQLKSLVATYVLVCSIDQSTTKWTVSLCGCTDCTTANLFDGKFIIYR